MANTNVLAIAAAQEALKDEEFYKFSVAKNMEAKNMIYKTLDELDLPYIRSHTNFVFFRSGMPVDRLIGKMGDEGVQIGRPFPPLLDWARISTGKIEEVEAFNAGLKRVLT